MDEVTQETRIQALYELSMQLSQTLDLNQLLNQVIDAIIQLTRAERCFLVLFENDDNQQLRAEVARNMEQESILDNSLEISRTVIQRCANNEEPILTVNAQEDQRFANQSSVRNYQLRSIMCVPLRARGRTIGAVYVDNRLASGIFQQPDLDLLITFAGQVGLALDNARLLEQAQAYAAELEQEITRHEQTEAELRQYRSHLEELVRERTKALRIEMAERQQAQEALQVYSQQLEAMVAERTRELEIIQEQFIRQEKLAAIGEFAGSVAHELRNPLGVISNSVYFLKTIMSESGDTVEEYLTLIETRIAETEQMVAGLLDFARTRVAQPEMLDLKEMVTEALSRQFIPPQVEVVTDVSAQLPPIYMDRLQLLQVLQNLITNAFQAMPAGGKLTIQAKLQPNTLHLTIQDTGIGMAVEVMERIFEPLFSTKTEGVGLGLAIVKRLLELNNGRISVQSQVGQGSAFFLALPTYKFS